MTVDDFTRYKYKLHIIRDRLNSFVAKHPDVVTDNEQDNWYLPVIGYLVDLEQAIDYRIRKTEVDFFR